MLEAITQYWYLSLAFVFFSIITVFVCIKAYQASKRTRLVRDKIINRLKYENRTRAEFSELTKELISSAEPQKLFDGVALNIQARLEKESDMNAAFENLSKPQKYIYALYYVAHDGAQKLSDFFKMNGKPLTPVAGEAVELILGCKAGELYKKEHEAFDDDNEDTSLLPQEIKEQDEAYTLLKAEMDIAALVAAYIKQNSEQFITNNS
ncbi:MAG: hypothetical protein WCN92_01165 [Eubacteriales bacterium]